MNIFRRALTGCRLALVTAAAAIFIAGAAQAQINLVVAAPVAVPGASSVLDQVPSDALGVVKINHLEETSKKLGELMQALGVVDFAPPMADPLGALQAKGGITNGLDKAGDAAVIICNGAWTNGENRNTPPIVILMPVSDYKAFLGNATVSATDGDISSVRFKDDPEDMFVANWGTYAAITPGKDLLAKKPDGMKVTGLAAKELAEKDIVLYVNMPVVKTVLLPKLQQNRNMMLEKVKEAMANAGPNSAKGPLATTLVNELLDFGQRCLEDTQAVTWGYTFGKNGVNGTMLAEFTPDSTLGKLATEIKGTDGPVLGGLPTVKYLFYGGGMQDPKVAMEIFNAVVEPFNKPLADMGDDGKSIVGAIDAYRDAFSSISGTAFGMVAPSGPVGQGALFQFVAVYKADAEKLKAAQEKQIAAEQDLMKAMGSPAAGGMKTTVTPNAKTVDGVSFDEIKMAISMPGNTPEAMQANQMINIMYGPGGLTMYTGAVTPKVLVFGSGINDETMTAAVEAAKTDANPMGDSDIVKLVDAELPKNRVAAFYIPLDAIVSTAVGYAQQFGMPVPVQLPPNLPPIGISLGTDGSAARIDGHIPTQLVQSLVQAGMQFYMQRMGGQGGQGGGGL